MTTFFKMVINNYIKQGTVLSAIGNTASMATFGLTEPAAVVISEIAPKIMSIPEDVTALAIPEIRADYKATLVWSISKGSSGCLKSSYRSEKIIAVSSRSIGIRSGIADNTLPSHWWMIIETSSSYYNIQFRKSGSRIELRRGSRSECDESGVAEAQRFVGAKPISKNRTLADIVDWLDEGKFSSYYDLWNNNCQHLCKSIYQWI
eukprot:UN13166